MNTSNSYPWDVLQIDATSDKKAIKKAYAQLIKLNKPDDDSEKFQEIQEAYKMALAMRQWQNNESEELLEEQENDEVSRSDGDKSTINISAQADEESVDDKREPQGEFVDQLYEKLHQMAFAPLAVKDKLENWKFIEDYFKIDDLSLKSQVAQEVFKKVAEYNLFQMKESQTLQIKPHVLRYMNSVFDWVFYGKEYSYYFSDDCFDVTFHYFDGANTKRRNLNLFDSKFLLINRLFMLIVDLVISIILVFIALVLITPFYNLTIQSEFAYALFFTLPYIIIGLLLELFSKEKNSLGKKIFRRAILDEYGNAISWKASLKRHAIIQFSLIFLLYLPALGVLTVPIKMMAGGILLVNAYTLFTNKGLLHDYLSQSMVTKRELHTIIV